MFPKYTSNLTTSHFPCCSRRWSSPREPLRNAFFVSTFSIAGSWRLRHQTILDHPFSLRSTTSNLLLAATKPLGSFLLLATKALRTEFSCLPPSRMTVHSFAAQPTGTFRYV